MVMHARKPQRISDGYFEKHQTHPYQKYNSKAERRNSDYIPDARYTPLRSPNGNVSAHGHGHGAHIAHSTHVHHHYSHLPDDRPHATSRNFYMQKGSEKERDRDYKQSRNKYTDSVRSPKEKRGKDCEREKNNHERCESEKKSRTSGMNCSVGRSSKYDKRSAPPSMPSISEWSEHISSSGKKYYYNCISEVSQWEKPREWDSRRTSSKDSTYSSRSNRDKRSRSRTGRRVADKGKRTNNTSERYWYGRDEDERPRGKHAHDGKEGQAQDMDISPDRSTPLSEGSYVREPSRADTTVPPVVVLDNSNQTTGSLLAAALPRIVAVPVANNGGMSPAGGCGAQAGVAAGGGGGSASCGAVSGGTADSGADTPHRDAGPPTPTHSENTDPHAPPLHLDTALPRKMECLGSYSSVVGGNLQHAPPMLTPSLVNYVRADLTAHVTGWPADILEKQANKFTEEAYQLGCLQCTRVSAELKCSRSLVRHTEIQATLQEQKRRFGRELRRLQMTRRRLTLRSRHVYELSICRKQVVAGVGECSTG
ncbi:WW domain-containing adapter protein with coiled-coil homolog isoform X2 [Battus philenor]|uniref:WW domain-containing adapter protein with coiled-coil homolog isoform X2 n=1 Tax=Battus philenor TaxID=42288 RepID=UPI0035CF0169